MKAFLSLLSGLETSEVDRLALRFNYDDLAWFLGVLSAVTSLGVDIDSICHYDERRVSWCMANSLPWYIHSKCRNVYLLFSLVSRTMTGGSGVLIAVPLPLKPNITDVALLPDRSVGEVEAIFERAVQASLPAVDCVLWEKDLGLVVGKLLCAGLVGVALEGGVVGTARLCNCHICRVAAPDFSGFSELLMAQETFFLSCS